MQVYFVPEVDKRAPTPERLATEEKLIQYWESLCQSKHRLFCLSLFFSFMFTSFSSFKLWKIENWEKFLDMLFRLGDGIIQIFFWLYDQIST